MSVSPLVRLSNYPSQTRSIRWIVTRLLHIIIISSFWCLAFINCHKEHSIRLEDILTGQSRSRKHNITPYQDKFQQETIVSSSLVAQLLCSLILSRWEMWIIQHIDFSTIINSRLLKLENDAFCFDSSLPSLFFLSSSPVCNYCLFNNMTCALFKNLH